MIVRDRSWLVERSGSASPVRGRSYLNRPAEFFALEDEWEGGWGRTESELTAELKDQPLACCRCRATRSTTHNAFTRLCDANSFAASTTGHSSTRRRPVGRDLRRARTANNRPPRRRVPSISDPRNLLIEVERINPTRMNCIATDTVTRLRLYGVADDELRSVEKWMDGINPLSTPAQLLPYRRALDKRETLAFAARSQSTMDERRQPPRSRLVLTWNVYERQCRTSIGGSGEGGSSRPSNASLSCDDRMSAMISWCSRLNSTTRSKSG